MDYQVKHHSNEEVRKIARQSRDRAGLAKAVYIDIVALLKEGTITTVVGRKKLEFRVCPDSELGDDDVLTSYAPGKVTITARESVFMRALMGDGRARSTLAHEYGHAVMHEGAPKARRVGAAGISTPKWLNASRSAEHQAKVSHLRS